VRLLVFYDENPIGRNRCNQATFLFRWGEDAGLIAGLPLADQGIFYFGALIGMPRSLLACIRPNLPGRTVEKSGNWVVEDYAPNSTNQLDELTWGEGYAFHRMLTGEPFENYTPALTNQACEAFVFSSATKGSFEFSTKQLPAWQNRFAKLFADLTQKQNVKIVMLYLPVISELHETTIPERAAWPEILGANCWLVGMTSAKTFDGLSDPQIFKLYCDPYHLNQNGQAYFTPLITPALLKLYESSTNN
jgi:hypothetical protein